MQALSRIFKQLPKQVLKSDNPFVVPDRAARSAMQRTAERVDVAPLLGMPVLNLLGTTTSKKAARLG
jgi:hypothetical protein